MHSAISSASCCYPGQRCDIIGVPPLNENLAFAGVMADKAFGTNAIVTELDAGSARVVIAQHPGRASKRRIDAELYKCITLS